MKNNTQLIKVLLFVFLFTPIFCGCMSKKEAPLSSAENQPANDVSNLVSSAAEFGISSAEALPEIVKAGSPVVATARYWTGQDTEAAGATISAYVKEVPTACERMGWKRRDNKNEPKYHSYHISTFWFPERKNGQDLTTTRTIDTTGWPAGDYQLNLQIIFYDKKGKDHYRAAPFLISIVE